MGGRAWHLRGALAALLVATSLATFGVVGGALLAVRVPQLEAEALADMGQAIDSLRARLETLLGALESRVDLVAELLRNGTDTTVRTGVLDRAVGDGSALRALYFVSDTGIVEAAGLAPGLRGRREDVLGSDLSANPLFRAARTQSRMVWSDKYLSALSGVVTVGLARRTAGGILLAEVPLSHVLDRFALAAERHSGSIWLIDRAGEIVADTAGGRAVGTANLFAEPALRAARSGDVLPERFQFGGRAFHPVVAYSRHLDWTFFGGAPAGLDNPNVRATLLLVGAAFAGSLVVGLLLAPFWAAWMTRSLNGILERASAVTRGDRTAPWPRGPITEFNRLSADLETMATAIGEREQKIQAIFNTTPVPMAVVDFDRDQCILDVNEAWCREFRRRREDMLGRLSTAFDLWQSPDDRKPMITQLLESGHARAEAVLVRGDGSTLLSQNHGSLATIGGTRFLIWASVDITDMRRIDSELRALNTELEARVEARTRDLGAANQELSDTLASLRRAQGELVRSEKMAALGSLVAGVAHELNTPLGNSLLAATSLTDEVLRFNASMEGGVKRSALERLLANVEQAADITTRNLQRAADLVTSFKQVAVDQTSSQRRRFELSEVVGEMVKSLRPSLRRTPYRIDLQVPESGLELDSYPGPLGQTIGNLVNNAVLHAFEGRAEGTISIRGTRGEDGSVVLTVGDDGHGIPAALIGRIFDPFVTSKMGRGGSGLGLHISYNAVTNILGGSLTVASTEGVGTIFTVRLPPVAPLA